jgi:nitric-oxide synthase
LFRRARTQPDDNETPAPDPPGGAPPGYRDVPPAPWDPQAPVDQAEAESFVAQVYRENPQLGDGAARIAQVRAEIADTGTYRHTHAELIHGARMAWRNAPKCIGRFYWRSLAVLDCRHVRTADDIYAHLVAHLRLANGGSGSRVGRPVMSVFQPAAPGVQVARMWNEQLIRYGGYRRGSYVVGDPQYVEFTESMLQLGWTGRGTPFDVLPLAIETAGDGLRLYDLPGDVVVEVPLRHPYYPSFAALGLRWHAVPAISHMRLHIGGVNYPLAPFSGWYLVTEVGTRNLADPHRYNLAPAVAAQLGLDTRSEATLWRDEAVTEINRAVLHSFAQARVRISDHHTEADRFLSHIEREKRHGRIAPADWTWIVGSAGINTAVFAHYYPEPDLRPNLYLDPAARQLARTGRPETHLRPEARLRPAAPVSIGGVQ